MAINESLINRNRKILAVTLLVVTMFSFLALIYVYTDLRQDNNILSEKYLNLISDKDTDNYMVCQDGCQYFMETNNSLKVCRDYCLNKYIGSYSEYYKELFKKYR